MVGKVPKLFTRVIMLDTGEVVKVLDLLGSQFTVEVDGKTQFLFYRDKGVTWELVK